MMKNNIKLPARYMKALSNIFIMNSGNIKGGSSAAAAERTNQNK